MSTGTKLIEDMIVSLLACLKQESKTDHFTQEREYGFSQPYKNIYGCNLKYNSGFLQQVRPHVRPDDLMPPVEPDLNVLPEATAIVVSGCFGISNSLNTDTRKPVTSV